jgi:hypothetical protein
MSPDPLLDLVTRCTVRIELEGEAAGTGFFVAPGRILTCAHVVVRAARSSEALSVTWEGHEGAARVIEILPEISDRDPYPFPDLALLLVDPTEHPCVKLDDAEPRLGPPADELWAWGFTEAFERWVYRETPISFEYEGAFSDGKGRRLQLKGGHTSPGMSGAPLLNLRSGLVPGVLTRTRDPISNLGAWAVPVLPWLEQLEAGLTQAHEAFHHRDGRWRNAQRKRGVSRRRVILLGIGALGTVAGAVGLDLAVAQPALPGTTLLSYMGHNSYIWSVAWSPDGKSIASGSWDRTVQVWDAISGHTDLVYRN